MKVFLLKDIEKVGLAGEIIKVADGFAMNYIVPRKLGVEITPKNEAHYSSKVKSIDHRKEVIASKTSMLAEKIKTIKVTLKRKLHDGEKMYGHIREIDIVDALTEQGVTVAKNQIILDKKIASKGTYEVVVKLSSTLQPAFKLVIAAE